MKIKRFFAPDIRQALRQVRETLGADAVILSNRSVDGGIELVAAMDYDETAFESQSQVPLKPVPPTEISPEYKEDRPKVVEAARSRTSPPLIEWSQDPALQEMRQEMKSLRRMMENQLSGLSWQQLGSRRPQSQELLRRLMELDLSPDICSRLVGQIQDTESLDQAWRKALHLLANELPVVGESLLEIGRASCRERV